MCYSVWFCVLCCQVSNENDTSYSSMAGFSLAVNSVVAYVCPTSKFPRSAWIKIDVHRTYAVALIKRRLLINARRVNGSDRLSDDWTARRGGTACRNYWVDRCY